MVVTADAAEIEARLGRHFMRIVNMCRNGITDDEIRITAEFCELPQWIVMRVARDMGQLTPEQDKRYQGIISRLTERKQKLGACRGCGANIESCDARLMVYPKRCCPDCKDRGPAICHKKAKES